MKKIIISILIICLTIILLNPTEITNAVSFSFAICINNLFPSLFPFLIISNLLTYYGFIEVCSKRFKFIMNKFFGVHENGAYILIMSMLSGSPSNSKYIVQLLDKNLISNKDANKLLAFTHFVNPLFIIGAIGTTFLKNKSIGIIILISHYLGNFIIGIIKREKYSNNVYNYKEKNNNSFINVLTNSINDTINTLMLVLGVITSCLIITTIIHNIFHTSPLFNGILEITQGVKYVSLSNQKLLIKTLFITFYISFGGFSIHMQVMSILEKKKIRYLPYFRARIMHGIISTLIVLILYFLIQ